MPGRYTGRLSNGGETVSLVHAVGTPTPIVSVAYADQPPWSTTPDGEGFSLVLANPILKGAGSDPANWRPSARMGGSRGEDDPSVSVSAAFINEVLTHTDSPVKDAIELYNPNPAAANIGHWFLTDSRSTPKKFAIPAVTMIPARGYLVFTEDQFNRTPVGTQFQPNSHGEEVYLYSADAAGNLTGYSDGLSFGAGVNGVSFGRYTNSVGEVQYPVQSAATLGTVNTGPRVGPIVISEIHYQPAVGGDEFVELRNVSNEAVKLYDPAHAANAWRLNGLGFDFPANSEIPARGLMLLVATDPNPFRNKYGVPANVPFSGLTPKPARQRRMAAIADARCAGRRSRRHGRVPFLDVDAVRYNDRAPCTNAAGMGPSIERVTLELMATILETGAQPWLAVTGLGKRRQPQSAGQRGSGCQT